jgi:hypothetical protein
LMGGACGKLMVIAIAAVAVCCCASVTVNATFAVAAAVGVPVILLPLTCSPAGRPAAAQVYGAVPPAAVRACVNTVPTVPEKLPEVEIESGVLGAFIVRLKRAFAVCPAASVTVTAKELVPATVGVPVIAPELPFKVRPPGRAPVVTDHVYGAVPPLATIGVEGYATPVVPEGSERVVMLNVKPMLIVKAFLTLSGAAPGDESVTWTVNVLVPIVPEGVPEITPVDEFKLRPAGNAPEAKAQVYGSTPPVAVSG